MSKRAHIVRIVSIRREDCRSHVNHFKLKARSFTNGTMEDYGGLECGLILVLLRYVLSIRVPVLKGNALVDPALIQIPGDG